MAAYGESWRALLDQQQADASKTGLARTHRDGVVIRANTAGDKGFAAADTVDVAVTHGSGLQVGHVGATTGLGDGQGADLFAGQHIPLI